MTGEGDTKAVETSIGLASLENEAESYSGQPLGSTKQNQK